MPKKAFFSPIYSDDDESHAKEPRSEVIKRDMRSFPCALPLER